MLNMTDDDKNFITKNLSGAGDLLKTTKVNDILDAISDWIEENGYSAESDYYNYNDAGREAQKVYDSVYSRN